MSRVLFLIDESAALTARVAEGTKSKADALATALNALLSQLATGTNASEIALVGYRQNDDGTQDVGCRWGGPLEGRRWVNTAEIAANPRTVEERVRKIPGPGGYGVAREETVRFPIWYLPMLKAAGSRRSAWAYCRELLSSDGMPSASPVPPLVIHAVAELAEEDGFRAANEIFGGAHGSGPVPLVFHAHLGSSARVPVTLYPSSDANLSPDLLRHAFRASSVLPEPLAASLRAAGLAIQRGARGLICNARMGDLIRLFGLVKAYFSWTSEQAPSEDLSAALCAGLPTPHIDRPEASSSAGGSPFADRRGQETCADPAPPTATIPSASSLVVFVLDRSCAAPDASANDPRSSWRRLQDRANDLIAQLTRRDSASLEIAILAYGADPNGGVELTSGFAGSTAGRVWLGSSEVNEGAIRVEEFVEQVSDGVGGLLKITRKRPVLFDLPPTPPASPVQAFAKIAEMLAQWAESRPGVRVRPVVVHCTPGEIAPDAMREAVARLQAAEGIAEPIALYHVILTDSSHRSVAYAAAPDDLQSDILRALWELSSPLLGGASPVGKRPGVSAVSRGMVVNAPFDVLADAVGGGS